MTVVVDCECVKYITPIFTLVLYLFWAFTTVIDSVYFTCIGEYLGMCLFQ